MSGLPKRIILNILLILGFCRMGLAQPSPIGPWVDNPVTAVDTVMYEARLKYKSTLNYNRDELNVYGFQANDIPVYSDEVISYRLKQIESPIPMDFNRDVKAYIELYSQRRRESVSKMLGMVDYYFPLFEETLDKYNLPHEFKYLSVVESALNPNAQSWCGATGLWQFMYNTGLNYGLTINNTVDERRDPQLATEAMCRYIRNSYDQFGDWLLAIASYNCGPGWVALAVKKGGSNNFWEIQQYLPAETRGYVPAFIAATYVFNYSKEYNLFPSEPEIKTPVERVEIDQPVSFYSLSKALDVSVADLEKLNPSYRQRYVSAKGQSRYIILPQEAAVKFAWKKESIYSSPEVDYAADVYQKADPALAASFESPDGSAENKATQVNTEDSDIPVKGNYKKLLYCIQAGDDLNYVCTKFNCDKMVLMQWNNLLSDEIPAGDVIKVYVPKENAN